MDQHKSDSSKAPEKGNVTDDLLILGPGFWQMLCAHLACNLAVLGIFAIFLPKFIALTWWLVLIPEMLVGITNWSFGQRKSALVFREILSVLPEIDGERILCAGAGLRGAGFGKVQWGPVYLTTAALIIDGSLSSPGGPARRVSLAEVVEVGSSMNFLTLRLRSGEKVKLIVLDKRKWRRRIEAALAQRGDASPGGALPASV